MYFSEKKYFDITICFKKAMNILSHQLIQYLMLETYKNIIYLEKE